MTPASAPRDRGVGSRAAALAGSHWPVCAPLLAAALWAGSAAAQPRPMPRRGHSSRRTTARRTSASSRTRSSRSSAGRSSSIRACAHRSRCLSNAPMSPDAFHKLFQSALEVHGFVALDSGTAIEIVPDANARFGEGEDYVSQAIVLQNIGAAQLVPILRPLLPQSAHLAAHPASNALIVADRPQNIDRMMRLIRRMDKAGTADIEVIALENASADEVVRMLSSLNQAAQAAGGTPPVQVIADIAHEQRAAERSEHVAAAIPRADRASRHAVRAGRQHARQVSELRGRDGPRDQAAGPIRHVGRLGRRSQAAGGRRSRGRRRHGAGHDLGRRRHERARDQRARAHAPGHALGHQPDRHPAAAGRSRRDHRRAHAAEVGRARRDVGGRQQWQGGGPHELQRDDRRHRSARHRGRLAARATPSPEPNPRRPHARSRQDRGQRPELGGGDRRARRRRRHEHRLDAAHRHARQRGGRDQGRPGSPVRDGPVHEHRRGERLGEPVPDDPAPAGRHAAQDHAANQRRQRREAHDRAGNLEHQPGARAAPSTS